MSFIPKPRKSFAPRRFYWKSIPLPSCAGAADRQVTIINFGHYVNDRPYAANSFLSVAIGRVFASRAGRP